MTEVASKPHIRINYVDEFSPHVAIITTRSPVTPVIGQPPSYESWSGGSVNADVMAEALIEAWRPNVLPTTTFVSYDVYDAPDAELPAVWLFTAFVTGKVGTLVNTGENKAVSYTMTFRCSNGKNLKIVTLNTPVGNYFGNVVGLSARDADLASEILNPANAWSQKQGGQPLAFSNITVSLNKRLRRKYDMI